jgi:hypothetical protein
LVSKDAPETGCHDPQHLITNPVPIKIIYGLEVIEVDYEYSTALVTVGGLEIS